MMFRNTWPCFVTAIVGVWVLLSPFTIGYAATSTPAGINDVALGILLTSLSVSVLTAERTMAGASWVIAFLGVWLVAAPFVLDFRHLIIPLANDVVAGLLTVSFGVVQATLCAREAERTA